MIKRKDRVYFNLSNIVIFIVLISFLFSGRSYAIDTTGPTVVEHIIEKASFIVYAECTSAIEKTFRTLETIYGQNKDIFLASVNPIDLMNGAKIETNKKYLLFIQGDIILRDGVIDVDEDFIQYPVPTSDSIDTATFFGGIKLVDYIKIIRTLCENKSNK